jgi:hypothetical protein
VASEIEASGGAESDHGEIESVGQEEVRGRGPKKREVENEEKDQCGGGNEKKAREPARRKQGNLTRGMENATGEPVR